VDASSYIKTYQAACTVAGRGHSCSACVDQQRGRTRVLAAVGGWWCRAGRRGRAANDTSAALLCQHLKVKRYMYGPCNADRVCHRCCSCNGVCCRAAATGQPACFLAKFAAPLNVAAHASTIKFVLLQKLHCQVVTTSKGMAYIYRLPGLCTHAASMVWLRKLLCQRLTMNRNCRSAQTVYFTTRTWVVATLQGSEMRPAANASMNTPGVSASQCFTTYFIPAEQSMQPGMVQASLHLKASAPFILTAQMPWAQRP
jgi:hypothetical protein